MRGEKKNDDLVQVLSFMEIGNLEENLTLTASFFI